MSQHLTQEPQVGIEPTTARYLDTATRRSARALYRSEFGDVVQFGAENRPNTAAKTLRNDNAVSPSVGRPEK